MKLLKLLTLLIMSALLFACSPSNTSLKDNHNNVITQDSLKGKWLIVNYWADWCEGCIAELPELNIFYQQNSNQKIVLLSVNYDHLPLSQLNDVIYKRNIVYPVLQDDPRVMLNLAAADVIPVTYIVNPEGKVVKTFLGPTTAKELKNTLQQLMQ